MAIDTLQVAKRLREAGFSDSQAEAVITTVQEASAGADLATKRDLDDVRTELRSEIREAELRLEAKIEAAKTDIMNRVVGFILGALAVNIAAMVATVFAVAKLFVH